MNTPQAPATASATSGHDGQSAARAAVGGGVKLLRAYRMDDIADLAETKADRDRQVRSVVVVGEIERGKSSLVNALVGLRELCPTGVDVATTVPISICPATDPPLDGTADLLFPDRTEQVPLASLHDWVTTEGRHVRNTALDSLPTRANVPVTTTALGDVTVIDTPGVGGLDPSMASLVTASAQQACVVVVVCDASSPLTAPEMAFIEQAGASVDGLIVAVTKIDKNLRRWKAIVEDNRRLLRTHLGREVTVLGVSSLRAVAAADLPVGPERSRREDRSGITALRAAIHERLDFAEELPVLDGLRTVRGGLVRLQDRIDRELRTIRDAEAALPDLADQLARLETLREQSREWEQYLARDLAAMRQRAIDDSDRRLEEIRSRWTERINKNGMEVLRRSPQKFTADMQTELQQAMMTTLTGFLNELYVQIVEPRFDDPTVWENICAQLAQALGGQTIEGPQIASKRHGIFDPTIVSMGVMGSTSLAGVIGLSSVLGVGAAVGAVWVTVNLGFRAMRTGKTNLLNWLRETVGVTKTATARLLEGAIAQARPDIVVRYREYLRT
uniref:dynamin family protein n=1 Tax=uncultured Williamsia sp. TaxID=259311 RepID=UPI0026294BAD